MISCFTNIVYSSNLRKKTPDVDKYLRGKESVTNVECMCQTCLIYLSKNKVSPCAIVNGMQFPHKPALSDLNELECRLLSLRITLKKLMQAPRGKQLNIHGNIVNVPADVSSIISMLPWLPHEIATIRVNLKLFELQNKSSALSLTVRPNTVIKAASWLLINSDL